MTRAQSHTLEIRCDLSELSRLSEWLGATGTRINLPEKARFALDVCAAEAVQNVMTHNRGRPESRIRVSVRPRPGRVELEVEDDGEPFNPLEYRLLPPARRLEDAPLGGRGIMLIRGLMSDCRYRRKGGKNVFTMSRDLDDA